MEYLIDSALQNKIVEYYREAGMDYETWSPSFNMHFGFGNLSSILQREKMLDRMTDEVFKRLNINNQTEHMADFGCGVGASMRRGASNFTKLQFTGLTIVPWQKEKGDALNRKSKLDDRISILVEDYHASSLPSDFYDGLYAIESICYSPPVLRSRLVSEMYRVLKRGARFVIADGFRKTDEDNLSSYSRGIYNSLCDNWALPGMMQIDHFINSLREAGFKNVEHENISWRVAPSVLHVPFVITKFLLRKRIKGESTSAQSIRNLKGAIQTLLLGLRQQTFGYYLVSGEK